LDSKTPTASNKTTQECLHKVQLRQGSRPLPTARQDHPVRPRRPDRPVRELREVPRDPVVIPVVRPTWGRPLIIRCVAGPRENRPLRVACTDSLHTDITGQGPAEVIKATVALDTDGPTIYRLVTRAIQANPTEANNQAGRPSKEDLQAVPRAASREAKGVLPLPRGIQAHLPTREHQEDRRSSVLPGIRA